MAEIKRNKVTLGSLYDKMRKREPITMITLAAGVGATSARSGRIPNSTADIRVWRQRDEMRRFMVGESGG